MFQCLLCFAYNKAGRSCLPKMSVSIYVGLHNRFFLVSNPRALVPRRLFFRCALFPSVGVPTERTANTVTAKCLLFYRFSAQKTRFQKSHFCFSQCAFRAFLLGVRIPVLLSGYPSSGNPEGGFKVPDRNKYVY